MSSIGIDYEIDEVPRRRPRRRDDDGGDPPPPGRPLGRRVLFWMLALAGACAYFVAAFLAFLYATFPYDQAKAWFGWQVEDRTGWQAKVEGLTPVLPDGVRVRGLKLYGGDADPAADAPFVSVDSATVGASLLSLVQGRQAFTVDADAWGGDLRLELDQGADQTHFVLDAEGLDLAKMNLAGESWQLSGTGLLGLQADLTIAKEVRKSEGTGSLAFTDLVLKDSKVQGIGLPEARFTQAGGKMTVDKGKLNFEETKFVSDVVEADVEGYVMLNQNFRRSRMSLKVRFKLRDDLDALAKVAMGNANHRTDDGFYHYLATGTFENPRWREDRAAARRSQFKNRKGPKDAVRAASGDDDDDAPTARRGSEPLDDEARQKRMEELERRREDARQRREERLQRIRENREKRAVQADGDEDPASRSRRSAPFRRSVDEDDPGLPFPPDDLPPELDPGDPQDPGLPGDEPPFDPGGEE